MANQQANTQRMMRPVTTNNLGLRHLLQQVRNKKFSRENLNFICIILYMLIKNCKKNSETEEF